MRTFLASVVISACFPVTAAMGDPVMFNNTEPVFAWVANAPITQSAVFNPTVPASQQVPVNLSRGLLHSAGVGGGSNTVVEESIFAPAGSTVLLARNLGSVVVVNPATGSDLHFRTLTVFQPGALVGPEANFENQGDVGYFAASLGHNPLIGDHAFVGFSVILSDGLRHFGYIELQYGLGFTGDGAPITMYQPIRWAYESLPNTPITVVPGPGAGVLLAGAAGALAGRRRRAS